MPELRPYQIRDVDAIAGKLSPGKGVLYQLSTGAGKTVVFSELIARLGEHLACVLVHRRELLRQTVAKLDAVAVNAGIVAAGTELDATTRVNVASIDTVARRVDRLRGWLAGLDLVVIDEAHHAGANTWTKVIGAAKKAAVLGCTATPWRLDGKALALHFHDIHQGPSIRELTRDGYLCPSIVHCPPGGIDLRSVTKTAGDCNKGQLAMLMDRPEVTLQAVHHYARFAAGEPAVAFCTSVDHARHAAEQFSAVGWRARSIDGSASAEERDAAFADLASGKVQVLTSCEIVSEGVDVPIVTAAILLRPTLSTGLYLQQAGRVLRPHRSKQHAIIIDCAKNVMAHGLPDDDRKWTLAHGLKRPPFGPRVARCAKRGCWRVVDHNVPVCPSCGTEMAPKRRDDEQPIPAFVGGVPLARIIAMKGFELARMPFSHTDLQTIARIKGYRPGWAFWAKQTQQQYGRGQFRNGNASFRR